MPTATAWWRAALARAGDGDAAEGDARAEDELAAAAAGVVLAHFFLVEARDARSRRARPENRALACFMVTDDTPARVSRRARAARGRGHRRGRAGRVRPLVRGRARGRGASAPRARRRAT